MLTCHNINTLPSTACNETMTQLVMQRAYDSKPLSQAAVHAYGCQQNPLHWPQQELIFIISCLSSRHAHVDTAPFLLPDITVHCMHRYDKNSRLSQSRAQGLWKLLVSVTVQATECRNRRYCEHLCASQNRYNNHYAVAVFGGMSMPWLPPSPAICGCMNCY